MPGVRLTSRLTKHAFKGGKRVADDRDMHSLSVFTGHRSFSWRLLGAGAGLSAVLLWALAQAPATRPAEAVTPHLAATVDGKGL
jgi:hypothetical protein